jgi:hypothetical protein
MTIRFSELFDLIRANEGFESGSVSLPCLHINFIPIEGLVADHGFCPGETIILKSVQDDIIAIFRDKNGAVAAIELTPCAQRTG